MAVELKIPKAGESITEVQISKWLKAEGETVERDESVATLETDKATVELPSPVSGTLTKIVKGDGQMAKVDEVIGYVEEGTPRKEASDKGTKEVEGEKAAPPSPKIAAQPVVEQSPPVAAPKPEKDIEPQEEKKADVPAKESKETKIEPEPKIPAPVETSERKEEVAPMSPLRRKIAERLVQSQHTAALLTTFNEIDMSVVMDLRKRHQEDFQKKHGVKLGYMSLFVKAAIDALQQTRGMNGEIRGGNILYRNYCDIGVAMATDKGLMVPVLRNAEKMSFAEIETAIADFANRARDNTIKLEELQGGTFTLSNGGVYGSLLSTPIVNPPQSGVLGMHAIQERPVAREGQVVIRPMMYVAVTYDHRIVDGKEAVTFLKHIKEAVEDPTNLLLEI